MIDMNFATVDLSPSGEAFGYPTDYVWTQMASLSWLEAVLAVSFGVVYLLYGWRVFKVLTVVAFGLFGMFAGAAIGKYIGFAHAQVWGGVAGSLIFSVASVPLMRYAVSLLGGAAGAVITGGLWHAFSLPEKYIWAGAIAGLIAGFLISFIIFKFAVILFTSLSGAAVMMIGFLQLINLYEANLASPTNNIHEWIYNYNWFLPVCLMVPTLLGMYLQNHFHKHSEKWEM